MTKTRGILTAILIVLVISAVAAQIVLNLGGGAKAIKGATGVPYAVYLNNEEPISGFQMEISYPSYLTYQGINIGEEMPNMTFVINDDTAGLLRIVAVAENGIALGENKIFDIIFDVDENAVAGNYSINSSNEIFADINTTIISTEVIDGIFEIVKPYNITFLPPISTEENFTLQEGATLPLKFNVDRDELFTADNSVLVRIYNLSLGIDRTYNASGEGDNYIKINSTAEHYIINIHTNALEMPEGFYDIDVSFNNFQKAGIGFELVNKSQGIGKGKKK